MKFTKAQVIALFLATAKADTADKVINGSCSSDTVAAGTATSSLEAACSSLTVCTDDAGCSGTANEKCGHFYTGGAITQSKCVYQRLCDNVGKIAGAAFTISCHDATAPDPAPVAQTLYDNVKSVIGLDNAGADKWATFDNLKIPSKDNFQTGWWTYDSGTTLWTETDKPVDNRCSANADCTGDGECCVNWPDTNNKRCKASTLGGVEQVLAPFDNFTPTCAASGNAVPVSAKDDLAEEAQAQAAQAVKDFHDLIKETAKTEEKWADMDDTKKAEFESKWAAKITARDLYDAADKTAAAYTEMGNDAKAVYDAELLKWKKAAFEACSTNKKAINCLKAKELRTAQETARKLSGYYAKSSEARETEDATQADADAQTLAALTAAFLADNVPVAGKVGSTCSAAAKCTGVDHCCGTATPKSNAPGVTTGQNTGVCASKTDKSYTNAIGIEFTHVCGAQKLFAAAGAILAATYLM